MITPSSRLRCPIALLVLTLSAPNLRAQTEPGDTLPAYELQGVTVTTTRSAVDRNRIPQKIDVVTRDDMDRVPATSVGEALRRTVPVDVIEYPGLLTGISIRGFRPQFSGINPRTLILLNGRPAGTNNLALLQLGGVERVEVLRGPASALYGSSAMGGVVNVVTRRSGGALVGRGTLGYGTFGEYRADLEAGGAAGAGLDFDISLGATGQGGGYESGSNRTFASDSLLKTLPDGSISRLPWTTADSVLSFTEYAAYSGSGRIGYALADRWKIDLLGEGFRGDGVQNPGDLNVVDYDSRSLKDVSRRSAELSLTGSLESSAPTLRLFSGRETVDYYNAPASPNHVSFRTPVTTRGAQAQDVLRLGAHELTVGADYTAAAAESEAFTAEGEPGTLFAPNSAIRSAAAFGQLRLSLLDDRLTATAGGRVDRLGFHIRETPNLGGFPANSERYLEFTPSAGLRLAIANGLQIYGNLGEAFVTPHAFNVAGYSETRAGQGRGSVFVTRGNPELRPESSRSWDAGFALRPPVAQLELEVTYFSTDVNDRIAAVSLPEADVMLTAAGDTVLVTTTYVNVDEAHIRGLEAQASYELLAGSRSRRSLRAFVTGTRIFEAEERFAATDSRQRIRNVADLTVLGGLDFDDGQRLDGRLTGRYVGERVDTDYVSRAPGEITYPGYLVFDLVASVRVDEHYRIGAELLNLGDEDYFEVRGYNLPGRSLRLRAEVGWR
ncbi:MAG: TonB-dependent receptor [Gemmatimonadota bacterium]